MLYQLFLWLRSSINSSDWLGFLNVLQWVEFRAVAAVVLSFVMVVAMGKRTIRWLVKLKVGDNPEFHHRDLNELMKQKANVPTMGGILIVGAIALTTLLLGRLDVFYTVMAVICTLVLAAIGFVDDYLKLTSARRKPGSRDGLFAGEKLLFQLGLAVILAIFIANYGQYKFTGTGLDPGQGELQMSRALNLPGLKTWTFDAAAGGWIAAENLVVLPLWAFIITTVLMIVGTSNAVNLTDGMDGLAGGVTVIVAFAMMVLCLIAGYRSDDFILAKYLLVPYIPFSEELAVVAGAVAGACLGFLWFNCHPAQVFMGDTGSLALGGLLAFLAVVIRQEVLLILIGGVFFFEMASVILQVGYFKLSGGKRVLRCAPIHHHYHLGGWTEQQVVVRFWLATAMLAAIALTTLKLR